MILKGNQGEHWGGMDRYAIRAKGARILASNLGGDTVAERIREAASLRSSRPNLKRVVAQIVIAHDKALADLSDEEWLIAIEIAKEEHDLRDAAFCAVLHPESHVHLYYMRVRPDGSVVSDSHSYRKNEAAARRIEQELGLPPPTPLTREKKVGDRQRSDNASRRGRRKQQTEGEVFMETTELRRLAFEALASSKNTEAFNRELVARGIEAEWSANYSGLKFRLIGGSTTLKASSVSRDLRAANVMAALQRNADLRVAAEQASAATIAVADDCAKSLATTRVDRNEALDDISTSTAAGVASRALPPPEADAARAQAAAGTDPLEFLSPIEAPPRALDDAPLSLTAVVGELPATDDDEDAARRRDRVLADEELATEFRALTAKQLVELRNSAKRPLDDAVIALALLEKLLALVLRILSWGVVTKATPISLLLEQRRAIAEAADGEIQRRYRSPATATERMRSLRVHEAALTSRRIELDARRTASSLAALHAKAEVNDLRVRVTKAFNAAQVKDGMPTTVALESEIANHDSVIASMLAPVGMDKLRRFAAAKEWERKLARARELRKLAADQLNAFLVSIQRVIEQREAAKVARITEVNAVLVAEAEGLSIEIRDRVPMVRAQIERDLMRERLRQVGGDTEDITRMRG